MKKILRPRPSLLVNLFLLLSTGLFAQTSWRGTTSTSWATASNWSNGVPTATVDVLIGDVSFPAANSPVVGASASCRSLTIGGAFTGKLTVNKNLTVSGNVLVNSNGTLLQPKSNTISVQGNWSNTGTFTPANGSGITFNGSAVQTINGTTGFRKITVNTGSTVLLNGNTTVSSSLIVNGTLNPNESPAYTISGSITVGVAGILKVSAATLAGNYSGSVILSAGSTVDYSATVLTQTVSSSYTYSTLKISGAGTKQLAANLPALNSTTSATGNIIVSAGIFDLLTFTANRGITVAGGTISVANGATIRIGGTNAFPANYAGTDLSLTSNTQYNGTAQTITALTYGNLALSSSAGSVVKSAGATAFTIAGNFTTATGAGTGVSFNAGANITISGNDTIGVSTTFNGGSFTHTITGNWVNNGTFTPGTGTIIMNGPGTTMSGSAAQTFNNLQVSASNITSSSATIGIAGNLSTTGPGVFTHNTGGTLTMSGAGKTISGTGMILDNLTVSGTATTTSTLTIKGNMSVAGSFLAGSGNITLSGSSKTISGAGTIGFYGLLLTGTVTTASNFSVSSALDISGSFSATAGMATFTGSATLNGIANLFNADINGTALILSTNSVLGIAGAFTITAGILNVTAAIPNTVSFNGSGAQTVPATTYHRLTVTNGGTKSAAGAISTNGIFTIDPSTTFNAASFTHTLYSNFVNNGTYTAATGTTSFAGVADVSISGATTFNILTVNKTSSANTVTLLNNISVPTLNMTNGSIKTGTNTLTITNTRTGNGIIMGNIQRTHAFSTGIAYAFESPDNSINFTTVAGVSSVTVAVTQTNINDFPFGSAINREYNITIPSGTYNAALRLHYEDGELNGNTESLMVLWNYVGAAWVNTGKFSNSTTLNYVEQTGLTNITGRWTISNIPAVFRWNGSVSSAWSTAANWTWIQGAGTVPGLNDVAQIGQAAITNQPVISTAVSIKNIEFGSTAAATLTLAAGGSLTTSGNISGSWTGNATHTINAGNQNLTINGSLAMSDGTNGHAINLNVAAGTVTIAGSLTQSGGANITISGASAFYIGGDFNYTSGTFSAGTGTLYYNGANAQAIAGVTYNNLTSNKTMGIATIAATTIINGVLSITNGEMDVYASTTVNGNLIISSGASLRSSAITISLGGNLNNSGTFIPSTGTITFTGTATQSISLATFNNIIINKASGAVSFTGNINVYGDFSILAGNIDLGSFSANRTTLGGTFTLATGASLTVGATNNFPTNYAANVLAATSLVTYNGTAVQTVNALSYGNLTLSGGGANAKTMAGTITVNGDLLINSGATLSSDVYSINLGGNWTNSGTFIPSSGVVLLNGANKTITGNTTFNKITVYGIYAVAGADITYNGMLNITASGSYAGGSGTAVLNGDLTNSGILTSTGTTTFSGTSLQTIRLLNAISSNSNGVINFNGTVSPVLNSSSTPTFATLNINNTAGINPSVNWTVFVAFTVSSGATFNGGVSTHSFYGSFVNNGTVTSSGTLSFLPSTSKTYTLAGTGFTSTGTLDFGGTGAIATTGTPTTLTHVMISNTAGVTPGTGWNMAGGLTITSTGIFNAGANSYTVAGNLQSSGILNGGTSSFTMTGTAAEISGSPQTTFYDYTVTGSVIANSDFNVAHNFTNNNAFNATVGKPVFTGSVAGTIGGTASTYTLAQFAISKNTGSTVTLAKNVVGVIGLDIAGGTLDAAAFTITEDAGGGVLNIFADAALKIGGTNSLPTFLAYALDSLSTVEYAGSAQTVSSISALGTYGNLIISAAGTKTANGALNIRNNFTLTNGTFVAGSFSDTLGGNWNMTSGAFTNTGCTLRLNGTGVQTISSTGAFNDLTINKTAGNTTLSTNITVNGTLNFTLGNIQTGANTLVMAAAGTLSGAASGTGWVNGKLQKNFVTGTNVSRTMEIGSAAAYSPATVNIASVTTAGNLTAAVTAAEHPNIATSGINANKSVNRYWSFTNSGIVFTNASITVNWLAADVDAGATTANFKAGNYSASSWTLPTTVSPLATSIQATGVTAFGDIAVGELITAYSWTGSLNTNWSNAANWSSLAVPNASTNVTIPTGVSNYPILSASTVQINNLTVQTGAALTISGVTLQISGTISNSGTFNVGNGTIELNGTVAQTIPANAFAANTVKNLIISNDITLAGQDTLTGVLSFGNVNGKTFTTGGFLTLKSNASGTARVADITNAGANSGNSISGNVTMERWIKLRAGGTGRAYRLLAPTVNTTGSIKANWMEGGMNTVIGTNINPLPLYGTQITGSGGNTNGFDVTQSNAASLYAIANAVTPTYTAIGSTGGMLNALTGYFLYIRGDRSMNMTIPLAANMPTSSTTLRTTGTIVQGTQTAFTNAYIGGGALNLVTNPYPSPIDWSLVKGASTGITNFYTFWDPNFGTRGGFITVSTAGVASSGLATQFIQSGQAFFVESDGVGTPAVSIQESHKTAGNNNDVFLTPPPPVEAFRTELYFTEPNAYRRVIDGAIVLFDNAYSAAVDNDDAKEINNWDENIAIDRGGKHLSIEGRPVIISKDTIPLFINNMKQQAYEFEFTPAVFSNPNLKAELIDNFLNTRTLLSVAVPTVVSFTVTADAASKATDRFKVVFGSFSGPLAIDVLTIQASQKNNEVQVDWQSKTETDMDRYEVEKSTDGVQFSRQNTTAAVGNSPMPVKYSWVDTNPQTGNNYYRIKAFDRTGLTKYSAIVNVSIGKGMHDITIYPNPVINSMVSLQFTGMDKGLYRLRLMNTIGQVVFTKAIPHSGSSATQSVALGAGFAKGNYYLEITKPDNSKMTKTLVIAE